MSFRLPLHSIAEVINDIWQNRDREYNVRCLVKRLQRIDKEMSAKGREQFAAYIEAGDMARAAIHGAGARTAGLRKFRFHDLRHTFGSLLIQRGVSPAYVQKQMGHRSIQGHH